MQARAQGNVVVTARHLKGALWLLLTLGETHGLGAEVEGVEAEQGRGGGVALGRWGFEQQFRCGGCNQPAVAVEFVLQLAGCPAGIAETEIGGRRAVAARHIGDDIGLGGERDLRREVNRGVESVIRCVEHESTRILDGPAAIDDRQVGLGVDGIFAAHLENIFDTHAARDIGEVNAGQGLVDDKPHGAFLALIGDIDNGAFEERAIKFACSDQKVVAEVGDDGFGYDCHGGSVGRRGGGVNHHIFKWGWNFCLRLKDKAAFEGVGENLTSYLRNFMLSSTASLSTRSFSACPAWPLTHFHSILWGWVAASSSSQSSLFSTGLF